MNKTVSPVVLVLVAFFGATSIAGAGGIRWKALDLDGQVISDAEVQVLSGSVRIASGQFNPNGESVVPLDETRLEGTPSIDVRFRATGREEVTLRNISSTSDQLIVVVLPKVYAAPSEPSGVGPGCPPAYYCPPKCRPWRRILRRCCW